MWNPANEPRSLNLARMTPSYRPQRPQMEITKSTNYPIPFWQHQDAEHEAQRKVSRRMLKLGVLGDDAGGQGTSTQKLQRAYLSPTFQVVDDPASDEDKDKNKDKEKDEDAPMEVDEPPLPPPPAPPVQRFRGIKTIAGARPRMNLATRMAARKTKWPSTSKNSPETSDSESSPSSSESDSSTPDSVIELTDSESDKYRKDGDVKPDYEFLDSEITIIEPPQPRITIPLPQIAPAPDQISAPSGPPEELVATLDEICGGSIRMQATKQLPFLLRNLRRGFRLRCNAIGIKTTRAKPRTPTLVRFEYTQKIYESRMSRWLCPLCELHGAFPNKDMLRCHLQWDHAEVILERWEQRANNQGKSEWRIHLLVLEVLHEIIQPRTYDLAPKVEFQEPSVELGSTTPPSAFLELDRPVSVPPARPSPSPSLTISQSPSGPLVSRETTPAVTIIDSKLTALQKSEHLESVRLKTLYPNRYETITPRTSTAPSLPGRETTQDTELSTVRIEHTPGPPGGLYPTPPPTNDPLGPAAKHPYLPANSEYEGPDIYYSCRAGGASVFDLLGTLPMEPFGVLEWDILEREEEIYESDDIKVEYKVMHALWLRWIMLNRTEFMRSYYKGVIAFIDAYWRMIHQAAGWEAMRYWLLLLLTQRFLTGREVAKALKHYEERTGMSHW